MAGVLVVEDDEVVARSVARLIRHTPRHRDVHLGVLIAHSAAAARAHLARSPLPFVAVILDVELPDGNGLDVLQECRDRVGHTPVLVMTGHYAEAEVIKRSFLLEASFVPKPPDGKLIERFILLAMARRLIADDVLADTARAWIARHRLTVRQAQLLLSTVAGRSPSEFREEIGVGRDRYKDIATELLAKCGGHSDLRHLLIALQREALEQGRPRGDH